MTTHDIAAQCEGLREKQQTYEKDGNGWERWPMRLVNPDGPKAAATIERQAAEIERLRANLDRVTDHLETWVRDHIEEATTETRAAIYCARAALTGEDK
jgi:hypothetical protein